ARGGLDLEARARAPRVGARRGLRARRGPPRALPAARARPRGRVRGVVVRRPGRGRAARGERPVARALPARGRARRAADPRARRTTDNTVFLLTHGPCAGARPLLRARPPAAALTHGGTTMGLGDYSHAAHEAITRGRAKLPREEVFKQRRCHPLMDPRGVKY